MLDGLDLNPDAKKPEVAILGLPGVGAGLEISAYYETGYFEITNLQPDRR